MALSREEAKDIAASILAEMLEKPEYSWVYEDDDLMDLPEEDQKLIYDLMVTSSVEFSWEDDES